MERIRYEQELDETPLPCDYFDLIGGTGTGGCVVIAVISCYLSSQILFIRVIALMLGRLRMSIADAIRAFATFSQHAFSDTTLFGNKFEASTFERAIKQIVRQQTGGTDQRMIEVNGCKTYGTTIAPRIK